MCAKASKMVRTEATAASSTTTPKRPTGRPSKTPVRTRRSQLDETPQNSSTPKSPGRRNRQPSPNSTQSGNDSSSTSLDFLGQIPSDQASDSHAQSDASNVSTPPQSPEQSHRRSTTNRSSTGGGQQQQPERRRKQAKPKKTKRKDQVTKNIIQLQTTTKLLIPRLPFQRLVRETLQQFKTDYRMQGSTLECLQEASEHYLVQLFEDSYLCCLHRQRQTLSEKDMRLVQILRGPLDAGRN